MALKPLQPDLLTLHRHHLNLVQAIVLVHAGRSGLQGVTRRSTSEATGIPLNTIHHATVSLVEAGFLAPGKQPHPRVARRFFISVRGWRLLTTDPDIEFFPNALKAVSSAAT